MAKIISFMTMVCVVFPTIVHSVQEKIPYVAEQYLQFEANNHITQTPSTQYHAYVKDLAKIIYYWGYPLVNSVSRTSQWQLMEKPGALYGIVPGAPRNTSSCTADYLPKSQRFVVSPNNDTVYGAAFLDLGAEAVVVQTPIKVPPHHYWTVQITDGFTNVIYQLSPRINSKGGKYLLVGPEWKGQKPKGFIDILRMPTNFALIAPRSFMSNDPGSRKPALEVMDQMAVYPYNKNDATFKKQNCAAIAENKVFPPHVTAEDIANDPDKYKPIWVDSKTFWIALDDALKMNSQLAPSEQSMAEQAKLLIDLYKNNTSYKQLLDEASQEASSYLEDTATFQYMGIPYANGWRFQKNAGLWGSDWLGRAQAAVAYIYVNLPDEAMYIYRHTDKENQILDGNRNYTITFAKGNLPPVNTDKGGFWSISMYNEDIFMLPNPANGRTNIGTKNLNANELKFNDDGSLTIHISAKEPTDASLKTNWLPAPEGNFSLLFRIYLPLAAVLNQSYEVPNVVLKP